MKISVTFHEEGTPIATVTFKRSRRWLVRDRVQYNAWRRSEKLLKYPRKRYDPDLWIRESHARWREHHNKGAYIGFALPPL